MRLIKGINLYYVKKSWGHFWNLGSVGPIMTPPPSLDHFSQFILFKTIGKVDLFACKNGAFSLDEADTGL